MMKIVAKDMSSKLSLALVVCMVAQCALAQQTPDVDGRPRIQWVDAFRGGRTFEAQTPQEETLVFPGLLKREALEAGNPLATYAAMLDLEPKYQKSKIFAGIYPEIRFNFEEFLGFPLAGVQAMSLPMYRRKTPSVETPIPASYEPESAVKVIEREAQKTRIVVWGEEHHLPQTRSLYEPLLRAL